VGSEMCIRDRGLSGVQRTTKFVKYLTDFDWIPHILTITPDNFYAFDESLLEDFNDRDVFIHRTSKKNVRSSKIRKLPSYFVQRLGRYVLNFIYQPDSKIRWKKSALELGSKIIEENNIEGIIATAPPFTDFIIARELSQKYDIPFIVDYRDSWVDNPFHYYPTPFHKNYSLNLEEDILKHANHIIVLTREAKENFLRKYKYISHQDISIIPHGFDSEDFEKLKYVKPNPSKFTITHSGVFQDDRTPKYFLKAIAAFIKNNPNAKKHLELRFIGVMRKNHIKLIKKSGLEENSVITGYVSHDEAVKHLLESDVLWLMLNDTHRTPGKLYEYFGARKSILISSPEGALRQAALASHSAIAVGPKATNEIQNAVTTFYSLWQNGTLPVPSDDFIAQYDRRKLTGELSRIIGMSLNI